MIKFIVDMGAEVPLINAETEYKLGLNLKATKREFGKTDENLFSIKYKTYMPLLSQWGAQIQGESCVRRNPDQPITQA